MKNYLPQMSKLHSAKLSTWRTPRYKKNAMNTAQIQNPRGGRRSPGRTINKCRRAKARDQERVPRTKPPIPGKYDCVTNGVPQKPLGTAAQLWCTQSLPCLHIKKPCKPDFGPGTSALRFYRVEDGWATTPLFQVSHQSRCSE